MSDYVFPQPCQGDRTGRDYPKSMEGIYAYFLKIAEELNECHAAFHTGDLQALAEELQDVITVCTSFQAMLGYNFNERQILCRIVNEKNRKRCYHEGAQR